MRKTLLALFLAIVLVMSACAASYAEGGAAADFSAMSFDELVALYQAFITEFQGRSGAEYSGEILWDSVRYAVGADIAPGVYRFKVLEGIGSPCVALYDAQDALISERYIESNPLPFVLQEGMTLRVADCYGVLVPVSVGGQATPAPVPAATDAPPQPTATPEPTKVTPEFKIMMDDYEAFVDEFIAYITSITSGSGSLTQLAQYPEMMAKYTSIMSAIDQIDPETLSKPDKAYYHEVVLRVNQKVTSIAGQL